MGRPNNYGNRDRGDAQIQHNFQAIIVQGDVDVLVRTAQTIGTEIAGRVTSSQMRGIFATVRQIQLSWPEQADAARQQAAYRRAMLLKPQIRYAAARNNDRIRPLDDYLVGALDQVTGTADEQRQRFMRFVDFFEAIIAYHKHEGGR